MVLDTVRARWVEASYLNQPEARCGHSAVAVDSRGCWGEEFLVSCCCCVVRGAMPLHVLLCGGGGVCMPYTLL
jgi:hypothetical protein